MSFGGHSIHSRNLGEDHVATETFPKAPAAVVYSDKHRTKTFADVWHAMQTERHFNHGYWLQVSLGIIAHFCMRYLGVALVIFATLLIACIAYACFFILLPFVAEPYTPLFIWHLFFGAFLLYAVYFSYVMVVFTSPGVPTEKSYREEEIFEFPPELPGVSAMQELDLLRDCNKCCLPKPPRSHHCNVCQKCVVKMDHHCPWINNCVGHGNYRYFISFMLYVSLATGYIAAVLYPHLQHGIFTFRSPQHPAPIKLPATEAQGPVKPIESSNFMDFDQHQHPDADTFADSGKKVFSELENTWSRVKTMLVSPRGSEEFLAAQREISGEKQTETESAKTDLSANLLERGSEALGSSRRLDTTPLTEQHPDPDRLHFLGRSIRKNSVVKSTFIICIGVCLSVGALCSFHIYLVCHNLTTIELFLKRTMGSASRKHWRNPYDTGSNYANFKAVFGNMPWYIGILPLKRKAPPLKITNYYGPGRSVWDGRHWDRPENWLNYYEIKAARSA